MDRGKAGLTVFFEGPFWVGVFERVEDGRLSVCRVVFGSEPRDYEVLDFVLKNYYGLKFSPAVEAAVKDGKVNPKRRQREAGRQTMQAGIGTKSQQALQLQREYRVDGGWKAAVERFRNEQELTREMAEAFMDKVLVYEDGSVRVHLKYDKELKDLLSLGTEREAV